MCVQQRHHRGKYLRQGFDIRDLTAGIDIDKNGQNHFFSFQVILSSNRSLDTFSFRKKGPLFFLYIPFKTTLEKYFQIACCFRDEDLRSQGIFIQ